PGRGNLLCRELDTELQRYVRARGRGGAGLAHLGCRHNRTNNGGSRDPELRPFLSERMCGMSNLETYREKAAKCARAADEARGSGERVELLGLASVYMALADYVDRRHEHDMVRRGDQDEHMQKDCRRARPIDLPARAEDGPENGASTIVLSN